MTASGAELIRRMAGGDRDAFARFYDRYAPLVTSLVQRIVRSAGWHRYELAGDQLALAASPQPQRSSPGPAQGGQGAANPAQWGNDFELVVTFEINRPGDTGGRYRRPYVVVWVEDRAGRQVRTVSLWLSTGGAAPYPWLPDLKRWHQTEQSRSKDDKTDLVGTIARPTRPPTS